MRRSNFKIEIVKIVFTSRNYQLKKCVWGGYNPRGGHLQGLSFIYFSRTYDTTYLETDLL